MTKMTALTNFFVRSIRVRKLFGQFDYDLNFTLSGASDPNRLSILYGDNGSGKTTVFNLLFHLMSPVAGEGHKSVLTSTKFSRYEVTLADGTEVLATRPNNKVAGDLEISIKQRDKVYGLTLSVDENGMSMLNQQPISERRKIHLFLRKLRAINVEILFMTDDRRFASNFDKHDNADNQNQFPYEDSIPLPVSERVARRSMLSQSATLEDTIWNVTQFFQSQAIVATNRGEENTNKVYEQLVHELVNPQESSEQESPERFKILMARLTGINERSQTFVNIGLATPPLTSDLITTLKRAKKTVQLSLINVLTPYINGVEAKLNALEQTRKMIFQFVDTISSFFGKGKSIEFDIQNGLQIIGYDRNPLNLQALSSGEKQLLSMFSHIVSVRDRTAVFIIDEPELSLNIKWQRRLVQGLLDCTEGSSVQFLMASHSMEILALHRQHVVQLK